MRTRGEGRNLKTGQIKHLTLCKSSRTDGNLQSLHVTQTHRLDWRVNICPVSLGKAIFLVKLMKPSLQSKQPHLELNVSVQHELPPPWPLFKQLAKIFFCHSCRKFASHHPGFKNCKVSFFDVLLQCERGQRYCIFVKYEIYHQSISKHNV